MPRLLNVSRQYFLALRLLGILCATKIFLMKALLARKRGAAARIRLKGIPSDFWMRPKGSDLDVIFQIFLTQDYELSWCNPYASYIRETCTRIRREGNVPLIIDAGANIGASTVWFAVNFPACQIFAIEPERKNFAMLSKNTKDYSNIRLFNAALWDRPSRLSLVYEGGTGWACRVEEGVDHKEVVRTVTVPELLRSDAKLKPVIVKVDIEGAETALLRSHTDWVDDVPLVVFEQHDNNWEWLGTWQGTGHAFFSVLARRKREYLSRGENVFAFLHPEPDTSGRTQTDRAVTALSRPRRAR